MPAIEIFRSTITTLVARDTPDLTARQMAVFLATYCEDTPQTVRGLAQSLNVAKPAITRALDRLETFNYIERKEDHTDRRSIIVGRTPKGRQFFTNLKNILTEAETPPPN